MQGLLGYVTTAAAIGLALNIGANNSAAEMGPAYGAGVRSRRQALVLIAVFCTLGAVVAGGRVLHTVSHRLLGEGTLATDSHAGLIVMVSALSLIGLANALRVPVATTHAVVGAMVGLGLFYGTANLPVVAATVAWWVVTPLASLVISYLAGRFVYPRLLRAIALLRSERAVYRTIAWAITASGCWMAFSAGSNNLANAMGPVVGAGIFTPMTAAVVGGLGMAAGALLLGGRLLKTVGKEITKVCPLCAFLIEMVAGSIVFTASRFGMPVSLAEIVTCSVIGFGIAARGVRDTAGNHHVRRMLVLWPSAPVAAAALAFALQALALR